MEEWYESSNSQDVEDTFYDSYTSMDGYDGPEFIQLPLRPAHQRKYRLCQTHSHWYHRKYEQCWYCWKGTSPAEEHRKRQLDAQLDRLRRLAIIMPHPTDQERRDKEKSDEG